MTDVLMPRLSDSMQEGTILTWLVADGATVTAGAELAEIETDKATMTYEAEADGVLSVVVPAGATVAVGDVIARVGETGGAEVPDGAPDTGAGSVADTSAGGVADTGPDENASIPTTTTNGVAATPMARRIAAAHGISLGSLTGSGPRGRVVRVDVERAAGIEPASARPAAPRGAIGSPAARLPSGGGTTSASGGGTTSASAPPSPAAPAPSARPSAAEDVRVQPSRLQATIARRMAEAKATVPHFQVQTDVEMSAALAFREQLRAPAADRDLPVPSLNDLVVKASAVCLRRFPRANGSYVDGAFELHAAVNVGVAVAADDALIVPVIHDADARSLGDIARLSRELAAAVRDGSVTAPQLSGATFTVSNLGMYGMTAIMPVVDPPQAAILGVGAIREELARAADGAIVDRRPMTLTLSCDHRILYGADAARLLAAIRDLLQAPAALAL